MSQEWVPVLAGLGGLLAGLGVFFARSFLRPNGREDKRSARPVKLPKDESDKLTRIADSMDRLADSMERLALGQKEAIIELRAMRLDVTDLRLELAKFVGSMGRKA